MEAIYWVLTWACHRKCPHCYDDRFRPYVRDELKRVVGEGQAAWARVLANLPDRMGFADDRAEGGWRRGLLVLAGGELLIDGVREELFYPVLDGIRARWREHPPRVSVQTTGDILTPAMIADMLARGVSTIAIASIDDYHVGHKGEGKFALMERVRAMMADAGVTEVSLGGAKDERLKAPAPARQRGDAPTFLFFGAQPDLWIGELWPRGRAWANGLSDATYETNFCARWSGGKNFLRHGEAGSEVAIEPDGSVYPCCLKTKAPLGNLTEERLTDILDSLKGHPAFEAINAGDPEAMGLANGWSRDTYRAASAATDGKGRTVENVCLGCDRYFAEKLVPEIEAIRAKRMASVR
jgi:MoaA/NifB/PqqE/SkfB family radical SAM enzyme